MFLGLFLLARSLTFPQGAVLGFIFATMPVGKTVEIKAPLGLPPVPIPPDNPPTENHRVGPPLLLRSPLSVDGTVSCASCHAPQFAFSDNRPVFPGCRWQPGTRHSPTVINSPTTPCSSGMAGLPASKNRAKGPMANPVEMAHSLEGVVQRLASRSEIFRKPSRRPGAPIRDHH